MSEPETVKTYPTERAAEVRVRQLRALGMWPGVVRHGDRWRLTSDPDTAGQRNHRTEVQT